MTSRRPSRKQARRDALFILYQREVTSMPVADLIADLRRREGYPADDFTLAVVNGVLERETQLDARLERHSQNWTLGRMAPLERSLLRVALWEIESGSSPAEVAIDEAVRLAKRYATDEAGGLVNGILGSITKEREGDGGQA